MKQFLKNNFKWIAINTVTWTLSKLLFLSIKLWGMGETAFNRGNISVGLLFTCVLISGIIDGFIIGVVDSFLDIVFRRMGFASKVSAKALINICIGVTLTFVLLPMLADLSTTGANIFFSHLLAVPNLIILSVYMLMITFLIQLSKAAALWINVHDLSQVFALREQAVEEDRIFMFVDMKSSTTHAERMGAAKYSALIRDCFADMARAAEKTSAEIYQYVGDEVIFTWRTSALNFKKSIEHYYLLMENLEARAGYYRTRYHVLPQFKAGIHHGKVIRTQVGSLRKSLAFHGDAINTASRIQGKCNELNCDLLVSTAILDGLPEKFSADFEGACQLRGRNQEVILFSIHPRDFTRYSLQVAS